jgi:hypothetical protein
MTMRHRKHGIWQFHRAATQARKILGLRWWIESELYSGKMERFLFQGFAWRFGAIPLFSILTVAANRWFRIRKIKPTQEQWNELVTTIAMRSGLTHHKTLNAAFANKQGNYFASRMEELQWPKIWQSVENRVTWYRLRKHSFYPSASPDKFRLFHRLIRFAVLRGHKPKANVYMTNTRAVRHPMQRDGRMFDRWGSLLLPHTKLTQCELCGFVSTSKKIVYRSDVSTWNWRHEKDWAAPSKSTLCMSCYNKVRPIDKRIQDIWASQLLINALKREVTNERKNQNNRPASPVPI